MNQDWTQDSECVKSALGRLYMAVWEDIDDMAFSGPYPRPLAEAIVALANAKYPLEVVVDPKDARYPDSCTSE